MQKILTPINVGATTNGSLRVEGVERGRATGREIGAVIKKHTAERVGGGLWMKFCQSRKHKFVNLKNDPGGFNFGREGVRFNTSGVRFRSRGVRYRRYLTDCVDDRSPPNVAVFSGKENCLRKPLLLLSPDASDWRSPLSLRPHSAVRN